MQSRVPGLRQIEARNSLERPSIINLLSDPHLETFRLYETGGESGEGVK